MIRARANKGLYLGIATAVTVGLGAGDVLPLQMASAAYAADKTTLAQSKELAPNQARGDQPDAREKQVSASGWSLEKLFEEFSLSSSTDGSTESLEDTAEDEEPLSGFVIMASLMALFAGLLASLISNGSSSDSSSSVDFAGAPPANFPGNGGSDSDAPSSDGGSDSGEKPKKVPTPALLPGLLAMGFKAFRKQQGEVQPANHLGSS